MKYIKSKLTLAAVVIFACALFCGLAFAKNDATVYENLAYADSAITLSTTEETSADQNAEKYFTFTQTTAGNAYSVGAINTSVSGNLVIPSTYNGMPVTEIKDSAFSSCKGLTGITIPSSVTVIEDYAFYGCTMLESVTIPSGVESIKNFTFYNCGSLTAVTISEGVNSIGTNAFSGCTSLTEIALPSSVTTIGTSAFSNCKSLVKVAMTDAVTSLGVSAFSGCSSLTSVTVPAGVTAIANKTFLYCSGLAEITMSEKVTKIGASAFESCKNLASITVPAGITAINSKAFQNCYKLVEVCNESNLRITKGSEDNGAVARYALNVYTPTDGESKIKSVDGYKIYEGAADECYLLGYDGTETKLTLPDTSYEYEIYPYAFYQNGKIESVAIPSKVKSVGDYAFYNCTNLEGVSISGSVANIGNYSFFGCKKLAKIELPNGVTNIGDFAFQNCTGLADVTIAETVTGIGQDAFSGCDNLKNTNYLGTVNQWVGIEFGSNRSNPTFYSKKLSIGGAEVTRITLSDVTNIGSFAFYNCENLTSVTIPSTVKSIGDDAFVNCANLSKVTILSADIYNSATSKIEAGYLLNYAKIVYVPKTVADGEGNANPFLNNTFYFQKLEKDGDYVCTDASYGAERILFNATVEQSFTSVYFNGNEQKPSITVKINGEALTEGQDYAVIYPNDITSVGEKKVTVEGVGNYIGNAYFTYTILAQIDLSDAVVGEVEDKYYDGAEYRPQVTVEYGGVALVEGTDYEITYPQDTVSVGEKIITVTGKGIYCGTKEIKYSVLERVNVSEITFDEIEDVQFSGESVTPQIVLKDGDKVLTEGVDYRVIYPADMTSVGEKTVTIVGIGTYGGTKVVKFNVVAKPNPPVEPPVDPPVEPPVDPPVEPPVEPPTENAGGGASLGTAGIVFLVILCTAAFALTVTAIVVICKTKK